MPASTLAPSATTEPATVITPDQSDSPYWWIPERLREHRQFICWRFDDIDSDKPKKRPIDPRTGYWTSKTDTLQWMPFDEVVQLADTSIGVGFVLTEDDPFFVLDFDGCLSDSEDDSLTPPVEYALHRFGDSFIERSVSGNGLHLWGETDGPSDLPNRDAKQTLGIEFYSQNAFIAFGSPVEELNPIRIFPLSDVEAWHKETFGEFGDGDPDQYLDTIAYPLPEPLELGDPSIKNGRTLYGQLFHYAAEPMRTAHRLYWEGNWRDVLNDAGEPKFPNVESQSEADYAWMRLVAWYAPYPELMDHVMRHSGMMRDKWDKSQRYRELTINRAIASHRGKFFHLGHLNGRKYIASDEDHADRVETLYGDSMLFGEGQGWYVFNGQYWNPSNHDARGKVSIALSSLRHDMPGMPDGTYRKAESQGTATATLAKLSDRDSMKTPNVGSVFDADPYLLCVQNGVIDLRSGKLLPHSSDQMISKQAPVTFDPNAKCPRYLEALHRSTGGDADLLDYLQRIAGYSLYGQAQERVALFLHGPAGSGKTTYIEPLLQLLGPYAKKSSSAIFARRNDHTDRPRPELMDLIGSRMVSISELPREFKLNDGGFKSLVANETQTARNMHDRSYANWQPSATVIIDTNAVPSMEGLGDDLTSKLVFVPFTNALPITDQKMDYRDDIIANELPGILNWTLEGFRKFQTKRLTPPDCVREYTADIILAENPFGRFIRERCTPDTSATTPASDLLTAYNAWADSEDETREKQRSLSGKLQALPGVKHIPQYGPSRTAHYSGIALKV